MNEKEENTINKALEVMNQALSISNAFEVKKELRDEIALTMLPEIIKEQGQLKYKYGGCENILYEACSFAYRIADAMIDTKNGISYYERRRIEHEKRTIHE